MNCVGTKKILEILKHGGIGIIPTDTIYGVAASAMSKKAVVRTYKILKRNPKKPFIILISSAKDLDIFRIKIDAKTNKLLNQIWPGKISVILPCLPAKALASAGPFKKFQYLHRGTKTLAFRVPKKASLIKLLKKTGPLISTSANPQGKKPAKTIAEAKKYFGGKIDLYVNGGKLSSKSSTLLKVANRKVILVRQGAFQVSKKLLK